MEVLYVLGFCGVAALRCICDQNCRTLWRAANTPDEEGATRQPRKGEATYPNGDFYVGEFVDGVKHGFGS